MSPSADLTFRGVVNALVRYSIILVGVIAALQQVGIQTTSILPRWARWSLSAWRFGTLSNIARHHAALAAPVPRRRCRRDIGVAGTVADVGLFATEVHRPTASMFVPKFRSVEQAGRQSLAHAGAYDRNSNS
jgi:small conductance mechanosensitive channel